MITLIAILLLFTFSVPVVIKKVYDHYELSESKEQHKIFKELSKKLENIRNFDIPILQPIMEELEKSKIKYYNVNINELPHKAYLKKLENISKLFDIINETELCGTYRFSLDTQKFTFFNQYAFRLFDVHTIEELYGERQKNIQNFQTLINLFKEYEWMKKRIPIYSSYIEIEDPNGNNKKIFVTIMFEDNENTIKGILVEKENKLFKDLITYWH